MSSGSGAPRTQPHRERVFVRSYPKIIVQYPTALAALLCGVLIHFFPDWKGGLGALFIAVLLLNTVVAAFEFPRLTALTLFFLIACVVLAALLLNRYLNIIQPLKELMSRIHLEANPQFYLFIFGIYLLVFAIVWVTSRFDYWEITPNEILHHHGPLSDLERFPAPQLKLDKEITDIFEFLLLRAGRLILHPTSERRAIVLDNVLNVNQIETKIKHLLGALEVRIDRDEAEE